MESAIHLKLTALFGRKDAPRSALDSAVLIVVPKDWYDKVNESDKEVSQSHTADQPTAL